MGHGSSVTYIVVSSRRQVPSAFGPRSQGQDLGVGGGVVRGAPARCRQPR